jgi:hypothetical protein
MRPLRVIVLILVGGCLAGEPLFNCDAADTPDLASLCPAQPVVGQPCPRYNLSCADCFCGSDETWYCDSDPRDFSVRVPDLSMRD